MKSKECLRKIRTIIWLAIPWCILLMTSKTHSEYLKECGNISHNHHRSSQINLVEQSTTKQFNTSKEK